MLLRLQNIRGIILVAIEKVHEIYQLSFSQYQSSSCLLSGYNKICLIMSASPKLPGMASTLPSINSLSSLATRNTMNSVFFTTPESVGLIRGMLLYLSFIFLLPLGIMGLTAGIGILCFRSILVGTTLMSYLFFVGTILWFYFMLRGASS